MREEEGVLFLSLIFAVESFCLTLEKNEAKIVDSYLEDLINDSPNLLEIKKPNKNASTT
jgi:hypothetical protein